MPAGVAAPTICPFTDSASSVFAARSLTGSSASSSSTVLLPQPATPVPSRHPGTPSRRRGLITRMRSVDQFCRPQALRSSASITRARPGPRGRSVLPTSRRSVPPTLVSGRPREPAPEDCDPIALSRAVALALPARACPVAALKSHARSCKNQECLPSLMNFTIVCSRPKLRSRLIKRAHDTNGSWPPSQKHYTKIML